MSKDGTSIPWDAKYSRTRSLTLSSEHFYVTCWAVDERGGFAPTSSTQTLLFRSFRKRQELFFRVASPLPQKACSAIFFGSPVFVLRSSHASPLGGEVFPHRDKILFRILFTSKRYNFSPMFYHANKFIK